MAQAPKVGALSRDDLLAVWRSVVDPGYSRPLVDKGDGHGLEVYGQAAEQFARVSDAIDRTTQAMYIFPWSGQTQEPSGGGARAQVTLTFTRSAFFEFPLVLKAGWTVVEEVTTDFSKEGPVVVATGRRYVLAEDVAFEMGSPGPVQVVAVAEREGWGYNNAAPGEITRVVQVAPGFANDLASVVPQASSNLLRVANRMDVVVPEHVGQYVVMTAGSNAGQVRRVVDYQGPQPGALPPNGGTAVLDASGIYRLNLLAGTFEPGEVVEQFPSGATGVFVLQQAGPPARLVLERTGGEFVVGQAIVGAQSGAQAVPDAIEQPPGMTAESGTASWLVLDWEDDFALAVTNEIAPAGGRAGMLDALGRERTIDRSSGEGDEHYRDRVGEPADVVAPNALARAANRVLGPLGETGCLREVGTVKFPGMYFDGDPAEVDPTVAFAYDLDFTIRPQDRFKLNLDYREFRAFFLMGVPPMGAGDFGAAYDDGPTNAYDAAPFLAFTDGFPLTAATIYRSVWQALDKARAGGVGFELYQETIGCDI